MYVLRFGKPFLSDHGDAIAKERYYSPFWIRMFSVKMPWRKISIRFQGTVTSGKDDEIYPSSVIFFPIWKSEVTLKFPGVSQINVWPLEHWNNDYFNKLYASFPNAGETYADFWIQAAKATGALLGTAEYEDLNTLPSSAQDPLIAYDYLENTVRMSLGALRAPYFYKDGTLAVNYGGFGSAFARELIKAFDERVLLRWLLGG